MAYIRRRYTVLFYLILLTLIAVPVSTATGHEATLIEALLTLSLLVALAPERMQGVGLLLVSVLAALWLGRLVATWVDHPTLSALALVAWALVGFVAAAKALRYAMGARTVDGEHVYAALSAYLLAGMLLGLLYWVIEQAWPGSFSAGTPFSRVSAVYFSFVTLATIGYGDVVPRSDLARGLAIVEGMGGQLFLAVLVARLVSLYVRDRQDPA
jgi:hypothetical protein